MCLLIHHVSCRDFWPNIKWPRWLSPLQLRLLPCDFCLFPKLKSPLKGKRLQTWWDSGKYKWAVDGDWENCVRSLLWRGLRHPCPMYNASCIFFNKCLFFIVYGWRPSGQTLCMSFHLSTFSVCSWWNKFCIFTICVEARCDFMSKILSLYLKKEVLKKKKIPQKRCPF